LHKNTFDNLRISDNLILERKTDQMAVKKHIKGDDGKALCKCSSLMLIENTEVNIKRVRDALCGNCLAIISRVSHKVRAAERAVETKPTSPKFIKRYSRIFRIQTSSEGE
jgi:hypothetical protein